MYVFADSVQNFTLLVPINKCIYIRQPKSSKTAQVSGAVISNTDYFLVLLELALKLFSLLSDMGTRLFQQQRGRGIR